MKILNVYGIISCFFRKAYSLEQDFEFYLLLIEQELGDLFRQSVEDTLNILLDEEADRLTKSKNDAISFFLSVLDFLHFSRLVLRMCSQIELDDLLPTVWFSYGHKDPFRHLIFHHSYQCLELHPYWHQYYPFHSH